MKEHKKKDHAHKKKTSKKKHKKRKHRHTESESESDSHSDALRDPPSPKTIAGQQRPPLLKPRLEHVDEGVCGPALPPHLLARKAENLEASEERGEHVKKKQRKLQGPALPDDVDLQAFQQQEVQYPPSDSDDDVGPRLTHFLAMPEETVEDKIREFERRTAQMREQLDSKGNVIVNEREEWMTELPPETSLSLGASMEARTFSKGGHAKLDRSGWTDTPGKAEPKEIPKPTTTIRESARDAAIAAAVDQYNANRGGKLLEQHRASHGDAEKKDKFRSFDRERDLMRGNVDRKRLDNIVQDAGKLDSKFSYATGSRFL